MDMPTHDELYHLIKELVPVCNLHDVSIIANQSRVHSASKGDVIFNQGDNDNNAYYVLGGEIELSSTENNNFKVTAKTEDARYPLAQFQPRQYSATSLCDSLILVIDRTLLDSLLVADENNINDETGLEVSDIDQEAATDWMTRVLQSPLFTNLCADNIQHVFSKMETIDVKNMEYIIRQGEKGDYYYIIQQGKCVVTRRPTTKSHDIKLAELNEGDTFGEESLIANINRNASVQMITDGVLIRLAKQDFIDYIRDPVLQSVNHQVAMQLVASEAMWLDVRFPDEYLANIQSNSINIPLNLLRLQVSKLDGETHYIVCCDTGSRSAIGAFILAQQGYRVSYLENGLQYINNTISNNTENQQTTESASGKASTSNVLPFRGNEQSDQTGMDVHKGQELTIEVRRLKNELQSIRDKFQELLDIKNDSNSINESIKKAEDKKLKIQRERVNLQTKNANKLIKQAQQMKLELEKEKQSIYTEVERHRIEQEKAVAHIREEVSRRLKEEEQKMDKFYAWKQQEIEHIIALKKQAETLLEKNRKRNELEIKTVEHNEAASIKAKITDQSVPEQPKKNIPEQLLELQRKLLEKKEQALKINENNLLAEINQDLNEWLEEQKSNNSTPTILEIEKRKQTLVKNAKKRAENARSVSKAHDQFLLSEINTILNDK